MSVRGRPLLWALVAVLVGSGGWLVWQSCSKPATPFAAAAPRPGTMSLAEAVSEYRKAFRLTPDRRFQTALADVHRLVHGQSPTQVTANVSDAGADLAVDGQAVGHVPPLPSFQDLFNVLTDYARRGLTEKERMAERRSEHSREKSALFPSAALPILDQLGVAWAKRPRDLETAEHAAQLLTGLLLLADGDLELDDPLAARALAALAVTRALDPESVRSEECLVSYLMGYSAHARRVTEKSPVDPAIMAFVRQRDSQLAEIAKGASDDLRARYLNLLRLATTDHEQWRRAVIAWQPAPVDRAWVLGSKLSNVGFETRDVPVFVLAATAEEWLRTKIPEKGAWHWTLSHSDDVVTAIRTAAAKHEGVFADAEVTFAVYGSLHLSALYQAMDFPISMLSSATAAREVLDAIPRTQGGPVAEMRRWCAMSIDWMERRDTDAPRRAMLVSRDFLLGARERGSLLGDSQWVPSVHGGDGQARERVRLLLGMLDSRPEHRGVAVPLVRNHMNDQARADWLQTSIARDDGPGSPQAWVAVLGRHGGVPALREHIRAETGGESSTLSSALYWLANEKGDSAEVEATFRELWEKAELRPFLYGPYASYLGRHERFKDLERMARQYLADPASDTGIRRSIVTAKIAESVRGQGRPEEAWALVRDEIPGQVGAIFDEGVQALVALGRYADAESLAHMALERYPHSHDMEAALAETRWRSGRFEDAARAVTEPDAPMNDDAFADHIPYAFFDAFEKAPEGSVLEAFDALVRRDGKADFRTRAGSIAAQFMRRGRHALAFEMYARLARVNMALRKDLEAMPLYEAPEATLQREKWRSELLGLAWHSLRAWKGEQEATKWALSLAPNGYPWDAAPHLFQARAYPLLWDAYPGKDPGEYVWLLRADAVTRDAEMMRLHGEAVRSYFTRSGKSMDRYLARVVLGIETEQSAVERPLSKTDLCQLAYYAGVAAQQRGDLAKAADYYQASVATAQDSFNAVGYARRQLAEWRAADLAFEQPWQPGVTEPPAPVAALR